MLAKNKDLMPGNMSGLGRKNLLDALKRDIGHPTTTSHQGAAGEEQAEPPKDQNWRQNGLVIGSDELISIGLASRAIVHRLKGRDMPEAARLEQARSPIGLHHILAELHKQFTADTNLRSGVRDLMVKLRREGLDQMRNDSLQQVLGRVTPETHTPSAQEFMTPSNLASFFPIPRDIASAIRQSAWQAAKTVVEHSAFKQRIAAAQGNSDSQAKELFQVVLATSRLFHEAVLNNEMLLDSDDFSQSSYRLLVGVAGMTGSSLRHQWGCHFFQTLCSQASSPGVLASLHHFIERATITPEYFRPDQLRDRHAEFMDQLGIFRHYLHETQIVAETTKEIPWRASALPVLQGRLRSLADNSVPNEARANQFSFNQSKVSVIRRFKQEGEPEAREFTCLVRWVNSNAYTVSILDYSLRLSVLVNLDEAEPRVFGLGRVSQCELERDDTLIFVGDPNSPLDVKELMTQLFSQLCEDSKKIASALPLVFDRFRELPGIFVASDDNGVVFNIPYGQIDAMIHFFDGYSHVQEYLAQQKSSAVPGQLISVTICNDPHEDDKAGEISNQLEIPVDQVALRNEVSDLLDKSSMTRRDFYRFLFKAWPDAIEVSGKGSHTKVLLRGETFSFGQDMRADEPLINRTICFQCFKRLKIGLDEAKQKLLAFQK